MLGSGISGLTAAHLLAAGGGVSVDLFEAREVAGGRANVEGEAEHCQRLFLSDYRTLLPLLGQIPYSATRSVRDLLVPLRRFVRTPTLGWVEISHQYSLFAPEIGFGEKLRIARASRRSILLARQMRSGDTNFLGAPRNSYSIGSKLAVARTFLRRQTAFALPGVTDKHLIDPWTRHLASRGVSIHLAAAVERIAPRRDGVDVHTAERRDRYDAVISTLFASSLRALLERSGIRHRLPRDEHAHCACFTIAFDPAERSPRVALPALYSHQGIGVVVQPQTRRCTALCVRTPRSDVEWVLPRIAEILELSHPVASALCRPNTAAEEALFIGDHIRRDRVLGVELPRLEIAGSWTRNGYPVDSGESAALSAVAAVRSLRGSLGLPEPVGSSGVGA